MGGGGGGSAAARPGAGGHTLASAPGRGAVKGTWVVSSGRASLTGSLSDSAFELKVGGVVAYVCTAVLAGPDTVVPTVGTPGLRCSLACACAPTMQVTELRTVNQQSCRVSAFLLCTE